MTTNSRGDGYPEQFSIPLRHAASFERDDFLVSGSNAAAVTLIDSWPDWPANVIVLCGPAGVGKSHLARAWVSRAEANILFASELHEADVPAFVGKGAVLIEDVDQGLASENALFHLINLVREHNAYLLLTGRALPSAWNFTLPDLNSRLRAMPIGEIVEPDEQLMKAVLAKLFADRQLRVDATVISYLVLRMPRSMDAARDLVIDLDAAALARGRAVTKAIARDCLEKLEQPE
jgi:chromosomal replication initiation ATPase DnaA